MPAAVPDSATAAAGPAEGGCLVPVLVALLLLLGGCMVLSGDAAPPAAALLGSASRGDTTLRNVEATRSDPMVMCVRVRYRAMEQSAGSAQGYFGSCVKCCGFEPRQERKPATVRLAVGGWLTQVHRAAWGATGSVGCVLGSHARLQAHSAACRAHIHPRNLLTEQLQQPWICRNSCPNTPSGTRQRT